MVKTRKYRHLGQRESCIVGVAIRRLQSTRAINFGEFFVPEVLGDPNEANDITAYTKPYPGDANAKEPVFVYTRLIGGWQVLVYFSRYCFRHHPTDAAGTKICSIDLVPERTVDFSLVKFSARL